jgi:phenylalanyl-tRNA synthetase beta subunit
VLRAWIIPSLLETLRNNKQYDYPQNIFESGVVFKLDDAYDTGVHETERIGIALCGNDANFTKIKQVLDVFVEALNIKYELTDTEHSSFIKGRVGRVIINGSKIAYIGEIHPQVLVNWALDMPVAVLEINVTELFIIMHNPTEKTEEEKLDKKLEIKQEHHEHHVPVSHKKEKSKFVPPKSVRHVAHKKKVSKPQKKSKR